MFLKKNKEEKNNQTKISLGDFSDEKKLKKVHKKKNKFFKKPLDLSNPDVLDVNLVKDELIVFFDWKKNITIAFLILILTSLLIFEVNNILKYWEKIEILKAEKIEREIEEVKKEVIVLNNKASNALLFKEKSLAFTKLLNDHIYWSNFFKFLEKNTLNTVKYSGFSGDISGDYSLSASAPSYAEASWQAKVLKDSPYVDDLEITSAKLVQDYYLEFDEEGEEKKIAFDYVSFVVDFSVVQSIFINK